MKITIYNPSTNAGGTNNLLANLAVLLGRQKEYEVNYIEFIGGVTIDYVSENSSSINIRTIKKDESIHIEEGTLIMILLRAKFLGNKITLDKNVKLMLWSTHPEDGIKILPLFNLFFNKKEPYRKILADLITPFQKEKTRKFFEKGIDEKGIVWMDQLNYEDNRKFYNLRKREQIYWPLITSDPEVPQKKEFNFNNDRVINICILGRIINFKTIPLLALLPTIVNLKDKIKFHIIGYGQFEEKLKENLDRYDFHYIFLGTIPKQNLDAELIRYDIILGMGTSVLESSKLGIPSLVMNGSFSEIKTTDLKYEWLYNCPQNFVGELINPKKESSILNNSFSVIIDEFCQNYKDIGELCYQYWELNYSQKSFLGKINYNLLKNGFNYQKTEDLLNLTWFNMLVNKFKSYYLKS